MLTQPILVSFLVGLIAVMNPIGNAAIYISMVSDRTPKQQHKVAFHCAIAIAIILLIAVWVGWPVLNFFGISVGSFKAAGGLIVLLIALSMMRGQSHTHNHGKEGEGAQNVKEAIAVVPLALPIIAGPGAISVVIAHSNEFFTVTDKAIESGLCLVATVVLWVVLFFAPFIGRMLGENGMKVVSRVMGLILASIAFQMLASGLAAMLPGLQ